MRIFSILSAFFILSLTANAEQAATLSYKKTGHGFLLVLKPGQKVVASLVALAEKEKIKAASFTGIGAVKNSELSVYDLVKKEYHTKKFETPGEVVSFIGNLSRFENKPAVHAHLSVAGPDYQVFGGHLQETEATITLEIFINTENLSLNRIANTEFEHVKTIDLEKK